MLRMSFFFGKSIFEIGNCTKITSLLKLSGNQKKGEHIVDPGIWDLETHVGAARGRSEATSGILLNSLCSQTPQEGETLF